jgi:quinol monooxygenase YgiN
VTFAVVARYVCDAPDVPEVRSALLAMREHTEREPANQMYVVHEEVDALGTFVLYEQYDDRAGFDVHTASAHFAEHILGRVRPVLTARSVHFAEVL